MSSTEEEHLLPSPAYVMPNKELPPWDLPPEIADWDLLTGDRIEYFVIEKKTPSVEK